MLKGPVTRRAGRGLARSWGYPRPGDALAYHELGPAVHVEVGPADVFAQYPKRHELKATQHQHAHDQRSPADRGDADIRVPQAVHQKTERQAKSAACDQ